MYFPIGLFYNVGFPPMLRVRGWASGGGAVKGHIVPCVSHCAYHVAFPRTAFVIHGHLAAHAT